jgi:hypothetical protein
MSLERLATPRSASTDTNLTSTDRIEHGRDPDPMSQRSQLYYGSSSIPGSWSLRQRPLFPLAFPPLAVQTTVRSQSAEEVFVRTSLAGNRREGRHERRTESVGFTLPRLTSLPT